MPKISRWRPSPWLRIQAIHRIPWIFRWEMQVKHIKTDMGKLRKTANLGKTESWHLQFSYFWLVNPVFCWNPFIIHVFSWWKTGLFAKWCQTCWSCPDWNGEWVEVVTSNHHLQVTPSDLGRKDMGRCTGLVSFYWLPTDWSNLRGFYLICLFKRLRATASQGPNYVGPSCGYVGLCWPHVDPCWAERSEKWEWQKNIVKRRIFWWSAAYLGAMLAHLEAMLAYLEGNVGPSWGYVGPSWGYVGPSWSYVGPAWSYVGPSWGYVGPSWGLCWPILRLCWSILRPMLPHVDPSRATRSEK